MCKKLYQPVKIQPIFRVLGFFFQSIYCYQNIGSFNKINQKLLEAAFSLIISTYFKKLFSEYNLKQLSSHLSLFPKHLHSSIPTTKHESFALPPTRQVWLLVQKRPSHKHVPALRCQGISLKRIHYQEGEMAPQKGSREGFLCGIPISPPETVRSLWIGKVSQGLKKKLELRYSTVLSCQNLHHNSRGTQYLVSKAKVNHHRELWQPT